MNAKELYYPFQLNHASICNKEIMYKVAMLKFF